MGMFFKNYFTLISPKSSCFERVIRIISPKPELAVLYGDHLCASAHYLLDLPSITGPCFTIVMTDPKGETNKTWSAKDDELPMHLPSDNKNKAEYPILLPKMSGR
jgi:hypothetical protein